MFQTKISVTEDRKAAISNHLWQLCRTSIMHAAGVRYARWRCRGSCLNIFVILAT